MSKDSNRIKLTVEGDADVVFSRIYSTACSANRSTDSLEMFAPIECNDECYEKQSSMCPECGSCYECDGLVSLDEYNFELLSDFLHFLCKRFRFNPNCNDTIDVIKEFLASIPGSLQ